VLKSLPLRSLIATSGFEKEVSTYGSGKLPESDLIALANSNPNSFIRVVKPQFLNSAIEQGTAEFLSASRENLMELIHRGVLQSLPNGIFLYSQFLPESQKTLMGWVVAVSADSYFSGHIKKHENTLEGKENRLVDHLEALDSMAEPVLLANEFTSELIELMNAEYKKSSPLLSVIDIYGHVHELRSIFDETAYGRILKLIDDMGSLYIADGHHRFAAASKYLKKHDWDSSKGVMSLVMNQQDLAIKSFHRLIQFPDKLDVEMLMQKINLDFESIEFSDLEKHSIKRNETIMLTKDGDFRIDFTNKLSNKSSAVDELEVTMLESYVLGPMFNLFDSKTDSRISFLRGDTPIHLLKGKISTGEIDYAFVLPASTFEQVMQVADQGLTMPPKSTWIEPKLMTGFLVQQF